jgi:hypothetical protein
MLNSRLLGFLGLRRAFAHRRPRGHLAHKPWEKPFFVPRLEPLEDRCVLTGVGTTWVPLGPAPQLDPNAISTGSPTVSGRVSSLAFGQFLGSPALYLGAASGGVWRSSNFSTATPTWAPLTDRIAPTNLTTGLGAGLIDTGSIATVGAAVYDGTGEANYSPVSRYGSGILKSADGGDTWSLKTGTGAAGTEFFQHSISKILVDPATGDLYAAVVPPGGNSPSGADLSLGVYRSTDSGSSWTKITGTIAGIPTGLPDGSVVTDLEYTRKDGQLRIFAAAGWTRGDALNGIYVGTLGAGGRFTWTQLDFCNDT